MTSRWCGGCGAYLGNGMHTAQRNEHHTFTDCQQWLKASVAGYQQRIVELRHKQAALPTVRRLSKHPGIRPA